jgi:pyridoxal phosphate enzyme (YggS family)
MSFYSKISNEIKQILDSKSNHPLLHENVTLVAVSKQQPIEKIEDIIKQGHTVFGENRVQEACEKWTLLKEKNPHIELHMIGHIQTNKAQFVVSLFDVVETLDSEKLVVALKQEERKQQRKLRYFIQVNLGDESQKTGIDVSDLERFIEFCNQEELDVTGLMCIPPVDKHPAPYFARLSLLAKKYHLKDVSMGMSSDYPIALCMGATHIRLGTALFGERKY